MLTTLELRGFFPCVAWRCQALILTQAFPNGVLRAPAEMIRMRCKRNAIEVIVDVLTVGPTNATIATACNNVGDEEAEQAAVELAALVAAAHLKPLRRNQMRVHWDKLFSDETGGRLTELMNQHMAPLLSSPQVAAEFEAILNEERKEWKRRSNLGGVYRPNSKSGTVDEGNFVYGTLFCVLWHLAKFLRKSVFVRKMDELSTKYPLLKVDISAIGCVPPGCSSEGEREFKGDVIESLLERVNQHGPAVASYEKTERVKVCHAVRAFIDELTRIDEVTVESNLATVTPRAYMRPPLASMAWILVACAVCHANKQEIELRNKLRMVVLQVGATYAGPWYLSRGS